MQFVEGTLAARLAATLPTPKVDAVQETCGFSLIMRTTGDRSRLLEEAIASLAAQSFKDFEVLLCVHAKTPEAMATAVESVRAVTAIWDHLLQHPVRVIEVLGGGRSAPLNRGLDEARGKFVCILDDDDLLLGRHFAAVWEASEAQPSALAFHTFCARRFVNVESDSVAGYPYWTDSIEMTYQQPFNQFTQLEDNHTPICNFFLRRKTLVELGIRFDDSFEVLEDWVFLMECARHFEFATVSEFTTVVNVRNDGSNASTSPDLKDVWDHDRVRASQLITSGFRVYSSSEVKLIQEAALNLPRLIEVEARFKQLVRFAGPFYTAYKRLSSLMPPKLRRKVYLLLSARYRH